MEFLWEEKNNRKFVCPPYKRQEEVIRISLPEISIIEKILTIIIIIQCLGWFRNFPFLHLLERCKTFYLGRNLLSTVVFVLYFFLLSTLFSNINKSFNYLPFFCFFSPLLLIL